MRADAAARARAPKRSRGAATASWSRCSPRARATSRPPRTRSPSAFASALVDWPASGVPASPEAWLLTVARRKMIDARRRRAQRGRRRRPPALLAESSRPQRQTAARHPRRAPRADVRVRAPGDRPGVRAPLILQTILGFDAAAIGSAFLVSPADDGPAPRAREEEDPRGRHPVPGARARRARGAPRRGARGDLRRLRRGLVRSGRHRGAPPQPRRRGHLARAGSSRRCCPRRPRRSACSR